MEFCIFKACLLCSSFLWHSIQWLRSAVMGRGIFHMKWSLIPAHLSHLKLHPHGCVLDPIDAVCPSAEWGTSQKIIGIGVAFNVFISHTPDVCSLSSTEWCGGFINLWLLMDCASWSVRSDCICISLLPSLTYWEPWCWLKQTSAHF